MNNDDAILLEEEIRIRILRILASESHLTQRDLAGRLGLSLGKTHYCLHAAVKAGLVRIGRFKNARSKKAYAYLLTPEGMEEKLRLAGRFLSRKMKEYEAIKDEIAALREEVGAEAAPSSAD